MSKQDRSPLRAKLLQFSVDEIFEGYRFCEHPDSSQRKGELAVPLGVGGSSEVYLVGQKLATPAKKTSTAAPARFTPNGEIKRAIKFFLYRDDVAKRLKAHASLPVSQNEFIREIINFSQLSHEGLVKIINAGIHDNIPYIVSEYVDGPTLRDLIHLEKPDIELRKRRAAIFGKPTEILDMLIRIATAIKFMHARNFCHCDIAPKNIFLNKHENYRPVVGDLGLGLCLRDQFSRVRVAGTKNYMPDDVVKLHGKNIVWSEYKKLHPRWDLFSFAKTAKELTAILPETKGLKWQTPLDECLDACIEGKKYRTIEELLSQLVWLAPTDRVPELAAGMSGQITKIIPVQSAVFSNRIRLVANHPSVVRLAQQSQLTLARNVFSGATHTRYEHALGTMETMRRYLITIVESPDFLTRFSHSSVETALLAALLGNITRHSFHHILSDFKDVLPKYEALFNQKEVLDQLFHEQKNSHHLTLSKLIARYFPSVDQEKLKRILVGPSDAMKSRDEKLIYSMLNSSLDVRVTDFIRRDSIHVGLSGFTFDIEELLGQLTAFGERLALREMGVSVAEQIIVMRYWLFNRVYWNTPNRAYVSMLRYALYSLGKRRNFTEKLREEIFSMSDSDALKFCQNFAKRKKMRETQKIFDMICDDEQLLYKSLLQISFKAPSALNSIWKQSCEMNFEQLLSLAKGIETHLVGSFPTLKRAHQRLILIDVPPDEKSTGRKLGQDIMVANENGKTLEEISELIVGVINGFAHHLRKLRIFIHPLAWRDCTTSERHQIQLSVSEYLKDRT